MKIINVGVQKNTVLYLIIFFCTCTDLKAQSTPQIIFTDLDNFWVAYDSVKTESDTLKHEDIVKRLYVQKGTAGLKAFIGIRGYSAKQWALYVRQYPKYFESVRGKLQLLKEKLNDYPIAIEYFSKLYPSFRVPEVYFCIGGLNTAGTVVNNMVLIGTELAIGDTTFNLTELPVARANWLKSVYKTQNINNILAVAIHEAVHTQQKGIAMNLIGQCLKEGSCDFVTELVIKKPLTNPYMLYGKKHEDSLKKKFVIEMFGRNSKDWLYNGTTAMVGDLGYFMGYAICKKYYENAADKKQALEEIIQLNVSDSNAVESFLNKSGYYQEPINKNELLRQYETKRPQVIEVKPIISDSLSLSDTITQLHFIFSVPMNRNNYSINYGPGGKTKYPITGVKGFSADGKIFTVKVALLPAHEYEFLIDQGFQSQDGYPLKPYLVKFKTN